MKRFVEDSDSITANNVARAISSDEEEGVIELNAEGLSCQRVKIISTKTPLKGLLRWFCCPLCKNRVGKLYLPYGEQLFLCRKCHGLKYKKQFVR